MFIITTGSEGGRYNAYPVALEYDTLGKEEEGKKSFPPLKKCKGHD